MAFDKEELQELNRLHSSIILDVKTLLRQELEPVNEKIEDVKHMLGEDIDMVYEQEERLKRKVNKRS